MARKAKKRLHQMPPLSFVDKSIYWLILLVLLALYFLLSFGTLFLRHKIAFQDEMVIACEDNISFLWFLVPWMTFMLMTFITWYDLYQRRKPIFGIRNFKYGPPAWPKEYPLFMKNKPYVYVSEQKKKARKKIVVLLLAVLLISFIPYPWSLYGRDCLHSNGNIVQYNMFNGKAYEFRSGDIDTVEIEAYRYRTGRSGVKKHWGVRITLTTDNGKEYIFCHSDFRDNTAADIRYWLSAMLQVKNRYDPSIIIYSGIENLEKVVADKKLTDAETQILYQIFGQARRE